MPEELAFMRQKEIVNPVKGILFHEAIVMAEQVAHGALLKPLPVKFPLAAGSNQPVAHQGLQNVPPARALPTVGQPVPPKRIQPKLGIKLAGQPAGTPLPGTVQAEVSEPKPDAYVGGIAGNRAIPGKERHLPRLRTLLVEPLQNPAPRLFLAIVDLTQIKHRALDDPASGAAPVFHNGPIPVFLAVLLPLGVAQKHDGFAL